MRLQSKLRPYGAEASGFTTFIKFYAVRSILSSEREIRRGESLPLWLSRPPSVVPFWEKGTQKLTVKIWARLDHGAKP